MEGESKMKIRKALAGILLTAAVSAVSASLAWAGEWKREGDRYWYENDDGSYIKYDIREIDGAYYGFDTEGYMMTGWQKQFGKQYYFSPESGAQARGWTQLEGKWYYLDPYDGHLHLGGPEKSVINTIISAGTTELCGKTRSSATATAITARASITGIFIRPPRTVR